MNIMKKIIIILSVIAAGLMAVSCGHDEPIDPNQQIDPENPNDSTLVITRVQDGNGKCFLENGVLVDANIDYSSSELTKALTEFEWVREYGFFYDHTHVSDRRDLGNNLPTHIHTNSTIEYRNHTRAEAKIRKATIDGKLLYSDMERDPSSSFYLPRETYIIVALDLSEETGRMIIDMKIPSSTLTDFDHSTLYVRMVWRATKSE